MHKHDVIIVGAGFSGLYLLKLLREQGLSVLVLDAGDDVGGTWHWNRYPGLRCDVESMTYSYSFSDEIQKEWTWTERYATQAEILKYIHYVADKLDLRKDVRLNERVIAAEYQQDSASWTVRTESGNRYAAQFCVMATGCLSIPNVPDFPGLETFGGEWYHTGAWPKEAVDFRGKRVAVVGTGSSGIQCIPVIAEQAAHLTVFQRTPNYSIPSWNAPLAPEAIANWKANYPELRRRARTSPVGDVFTPPTISALSVSDAEREEEYERRWRDGSFGFLSAYNDLLRNEDANRTAQAFFRRKIAEKVEDPERAAVLMPSEHLGTKRMCVDTDYFETFNRDNVDLVDLRVTPLKGINATGLATTDAQHDVDIIVFATGYDAITGALMRMNIRGRDGLSLNDEWADGPHTYLGLAMPGFPNLFTVTGPHSPSVVTNMMVAIEQHVEWIAACVAYLRANDVEVIEASKAAERDWMNHVEEVASATLFPQANSWYLGSNIDGKPRVCMPYVGGLGAYTAVCEEVVADGYRGFTLAKAGPAQTKRTG